jgi:hypothetical protein
VLKVNCDALLATVGNFKEWVWAILVKVQQVAKRTLGITFWWFNLDYFSTEIGHDGAGGWHEGPCRDLKNADSC